MKQFSKNKLALETVAAGAAGAVLQLLLYRFGSEESGLMIRYHPFSLGFWALAFFDVLLVLLLNRQDPEWKPEPPVGLTAGLAPIFMGLGLVTAVIFRENFGVFARVDQILGILSAAALIGIGVLRIRSQKPVFLMTVPVCVFFVVHLIYCYQQWRSLTQLVGISVEMAAELLLTLYAYQQSALDLSESTMKSQMRLGALTGFFSLSAIPGSEMPAFYAGAALWCILNLVSLPGERKG